MSLITKGMLKTWAHHWLISTGILLVVGGLSTLVLGPLGWIVGAVAAHGFYDGREFSDLERESGPFPAMFTPTGFRKVSLQQRIDHIGDLAGATGNLVLVLVLVL